MYSASIYCADLVVRHACLWRSDLHHFVLPLSRYHFNLFTPFWPVGQSEAGQLTEGGLSGNRDGHQHLRISMLVFAIYPAKSVIPPLQLSRITLSVTFFSTQLSQKKDLSLKRQHLSLGLDCPLVFKIHTILVLLGSSCPSVHPAMICCL